MIKSICFLGLLLLLTGPSLRAQDAGFVRELNYGINFNTNGGIIGGASLRSSKSISERWQQFWGVEIVEVKHPKESRYLGANGVFVLGKSNYLFVVRPEFGREYLFFRKAAESGVEVNGVFGVGPSFGLLVPYYIDYDPGLLNQNQPPNERRVRYDPLGQHRESMGIVRSAGFLAGIDETNVNIGAHLRIAVSFEYGRYYESITGIETGFMLEAFPNRLVLLPEADNNRVFSSVYLTWYYGRRR